MTTKKTSQAQHETPSAAIPGFPGMGAMPGFPAMPGAEVWRSMMEGQTARFEKALAEMERLEKERQERTLTAIDDMGSLLKSTLAYQQELADQWRKLGLEAMKKSMAVSEA